MLAERLVLPMFLVGLAGATLGWFLQVQDPFGFYVYLLIVLVIALVAFPFFAKRAEGALSMGIYSAALVAKIAASAARHWMVFGLYKGAGDSARYHAAGSRIAEVLRLKEYSILEGFQLGSNALDYLTGICYAVLPESLEGIFLLFSLCAFFGSVFYLLAFRTAFPERDPGTYAAIVLFLPSILFWPASLGKDALTFFGFGVVAYGVALQWVRHAPHGLIWITAGLVPVLVVRPHAAGIFVVAACAAALWSLLGTTRGLFTRLAGSVLIGVIGLYVIRVNAKVLFGAEVEELSSDQVVELYQQRQQSTRVGGSAVDMPTEVRGIATLYVIGTVLLRPFPWEVRSAAAALTALENLFFLWFFWRQRKQFVGNLRLSMKNMLLALCIFFSLGIMAFQSGTANLGIIARQRVQFLPYLFMLFA